MVKHADLLHAGPLHADLQVDLIARPAVSG
jgi:hypothetical protein